MASAARPDGDSSSLHLPPPPWIVGHRGVRAEVTENTMAGFREAIAQGADMVEMDVQLTADGVLIVAHDWDLVRLAGRQEVVEETTASTLATLRVRDPAASADGGAHAIPHLAEVLDELAGTVPLNLELKRRRANPEALLDALEAQLSRRTGLLVSSFDWELLAALRARRPALPLAPLASRDRRALLAAGERLGASTLHCKASLATRPLAARAAAAGRPLLAYTVNDPRRAASLLRRGVAGVFTDRPGALRRELEASG
ncbi:MAG: glycerophosphodiester phosphodiesterase family protein [Thermoanaerobaculia bacterium]